MFGMYRPLLESYLQKKKAKRLPNKELIKGILTTRYQTPSHMQRRTHPPPFQAQASILPISSTTSLASSLALLMASSRATSSCQSSTSQAELMLPVLRPMPSTAMTKGLKSQMPVRLSTYMAMNGQPSRAVPTGTYHEAVRQNLLA